MLPEAVAHVPRSPTAPLPRCYATLRVLAGTTSGCAATLPFSRLSDQRIERERTGARDDERDRRAEERERELDSGRREEAVLEVHGQDRDDHRRADAERREAREETEGDRDAAEELDERHERSENAGRRNAHLRERTAHAAEAEDEQLLSAVQDERDAEHDAEHRERGVDLSAGRRMEEQHGRMPRVVFLEVMSLVFYCSV